jgi:hypothetical protein
MRIWRKTIADSPWIETRFTSILEKDFHHGLILNQEITKMVFNKDGIISGKSMNRKKLLMCGRNMKNII